LSSFTFDSKRVAKDSTRPSIFLTSKFVVGSSKAKIPQLEQKFSAKANQMMIEPSTFYPAEHRPLISISLSS